MVETQQNPHEKAEFTALCMMRDDVITIRNALHHQTMLLELILQAIKEKK